MFPYEDSKIVLFVSVRTRKEITLAFMTQGPPPYCGNCLVPLTICHILTECPDHLELRRTCFGSDGLARPLHLSHILRDDELAVSALFTFLRGSGLLPLI